MTPVFPFQMLLLSLSKKKKYIFKCFHEKIVTLLFLVWNSNLFYCFFLNAFPCFLKSSAVKVLYTCTYLFFNNSTLSTNIQHWIWPRFWLLCHCWGYKENQGTPITLYLILAYFITFRILKIVTAAKNPSFCCLWSFDGYLLQSAIQGDLCIRAS